MIQIISGTQTDRMIEPESDKSRALASFMLAVCYGLLFYCLQLFMYNIGLASSLPAEADLCQWDAGVYQSVAKAGYYYHSTNDNNTGVYVLFPWVWKLLHTSVVGMAFFNLIIFAAGFAIITSVCPVPAQHKILWLTTPSLYFMWVPYSEALFCLLSAISFYGIVKNNKWLTWVALFLVSLTRATAIFLIPALLVMELLSNEKSEIRKSLRHYILRYASPVMSGLFAFAVIQFIYTAQWFPYFKEQTTHLGHMLSWPVLPFYNAYGGDRITWLSALAMLPCTIAIVIVINKLYKWLKTGASQGGKIWLLTLGYLPVILFTMVFCNPKWGIGRTNLLGIHRYVFCSPYFFVFLYYTTYRTRYSLKHFAALLLLSNAVWLTMGSYWHIRLLLFYNFNTLLATGYMFHGNRKPWVTACLCSVNLLLQVSLYQQFLAGLFTD